MRGSLEIGAEIGGHRLLARLGRGGLGEVWAALRRDPQTGFEKVVALKLLHQAEQSANRALLFIDEARAVASLDHPAIVATTDLGQEGDRVFIAMELIEGPTLDEYARRIRAVGSRFDPAIIAYIGARIALALDHAHDQATYNAKPMRLVHRDVSPQNILIDIHGVVRLSDFGAAKWADQLHQTVAGGTRGKPAYMSPEQAGDGGLDTRSDLFSLGIVLHELATGRRLYNFETGVECMRAILTQSAPVLSEVVDGFPTRLSEIIESCLRINKEARVQKAKELHDALEAFCRTSGADLRASLAESVIRHFPPRDLSSLLSVSNQARDVQRPTGDDRTVTATSGGQSSEGSVTLPSTAPRPPWRRPTFQLTLLSIAVAVAAGTSLLLEPEQASNAPIVRAPLDPQDLVQIKQWPTDQVTVPSSERKVIREDERKAGRKARKEKKVERDVSPAADTPNGSVLERSEIVRLIQALRETNPDAAAELMGRLAEIDSEDVGRLIELRDRAHRILKSGK